MLFPRSHASLAAAARSCTQESQHEAEHLQQAQSQELSSQQQQPQQISQGCLAKPVTKSVGTSVSRVELYMEHTPSPLKLAFSYARARSLSMGIDPLGVLNTEFCSRAASAGLYLDKSKEVSCFFCGWNSKCLSWCDARGSSRLCMTFIQYAFDAHARLSCVAHDDPHLCTIRCPSCLFQMTSSFGKAGSTCVACGLLLVIPDAFGRPPQFSSRSGKRGVPAIVLSPPPLPLPFRDNTHRSGSRFKR